MNNYSIYLASESEKYNLIHLVRAAGATVSGVSGCGTGYYIQINATSDQVNEINARLEEIA